MKIKELLQKESRDAHAVAYYSFIRLSEEMNVELKHILKESGITHAQLNILYHLTKEHPETLTPGELKERVIVTSPDMTRLLDRLVDKQLVNRKPCLDNRRKVDVSITKKGLKLFERVHLRSQDETRMFFRDALTKKEALELARLIKKIKG